MQWYFDTKSDFVLTLNQLDYGWLSFRGGKYNVENCSVKFCIEGVEIPFSDSPITVN